MGDTLTQDADSSWILRRSTGRVDRFAAGVDPTQFFAITTTGDSLSRAADGTFALRNPQTGAVRKFSKEGRLTLIQDSGVTRVALDYNAAGRLTAARPGGSASRAIQFAYTGDGHISSITDASGRAVQFGYDGDNLVPQTNADGSAIAYAYDGGGHMTSAGSSAISYSGDGDWRMFLDHTAGWQLPAIRPRRGRQVQVVDAADNITTTIYRRGPDTVDHRSRGEHHHVRL